MNIDIPIIISAIAIVMAVIWNIIQSWLMNKQLKIQNDQIRTDLFAEYTKRYQEIILHLPINIDEEEFELSKLSKSEIDQTIRYIRVYFDLCSEEFFLHEKKGLTKRFGKNGSKEWTITLKILFTGKSGTSITATLNTTANSRDLLKMN